MAAVDPHAPAAVTVERILALALLVFFVDAWLTGLAGVDTGIVALVTGIVAAAVLVTPLLGKSGEATFRTRLAQLLSPLLRTPVLVTLWGVFLLVGSCAGSLTVVGEGGRAAVVLRPASGVGEERTRSTAPDAQEVRFGCLTTPFGRSFTLEVDGRLPEHVVVYPWVTKTVRVSRDLRVAPSLLVRVPWHLHAVLDGGTLEIAVGDEPPFSFPTTGDQGAVLLGRRRSVADLLPWWRLELEAGAAPPEGIARSLFIWSRPQASDVPLRPRDAVVASFRQEGGVVRARAEVEVTDEALQDVVLVAAGGGP